MTALSAEWSRIDAWMRANAPEKHRVSPPSRPDQRDELARKGVPVARSTMNELLHRASALLAPVWRRLLDVVRTRDVVLADETRLRILKDASGKPKTGFVWTSGAADASGEYDIAY